MTSERRELAEDRTDLAEDRTSLATERTFAGWMRTGLAAVGIGLGFQALFGSIEPVWIPKALATVFVLIAVFVFWRAQRLACRSFERLDTHEVDTASRRDLRLIALAFSAGALGLVAGLWVLV